MKIKLLTAALLAVVAIGGIGIAAKAHAYYCQTSCYGNTCQTFCY